MSQLYSRVFLSILDSSIAEDFTMRHVFEDFLKLADYHTGIVDATRQSLSRRLNIPMEILNAEIAKLESPDPASRDPDFDGRRIERLDPHRDWGWRILNWEKYEGVKNRADVAMRVARHREKKKAATPVTSSVTPPPPAKTAANPPQPKFADDTQTPGSKIHPEARTVLHYLNEKSGRKYRETSVNLSFITQRLNEQDVSLAGVKRMIDRMCQKWLNTDQADYLRPETLFNKTKFDGYYAAREEPVHAANTRPSQQTARPNPRNEHTVHSTTDITEVLKRRELAEEMAADGAGFTPGLPLDLDRDQNGRGDLQPS